MGLTNSGYQADSTVSGTITAVNGTVSISTIGCGTVQYTTTGTWVATLVTEISYDNGSTWYQIPTTDTSTNANLSLVSWGNAFNTDPWVANVAGTTMFRLRASAYTSGTVTVQLDASPAVTEALSPLADRQYTGTIAAASGVQNISTSGCASCGVAVTGTWVGTLTFQGSIDNITFFTIPAINVSTNAQATTTTANGNFLVSCGGYNTVQVTMTAYTSGTATINFDASAGANQQNAKLQDTSGNGITSTASSTKQALDVMITAPSKATYLAGIPHFTPPATPTDMIVMQGSSTKTVKILKITLYSTQTTAGNNAFFLIRRSAANTGGTPTTTTARALDTNNAAATAVFTNYTVNPTALGASAGTLDVPYISTLVPGGAIQPFVWDFTNNQGEPLTLRGTSDYLVINFNGATLPGGLSVGASILYTEE
jgi:hypothetical protein